MWAVKFSARIFPAGLLLSRFRRRLARVTAREAVDVRLRALDVVLGRVPPPTEEWLEAEARLADSTSTAWGVCGLTSPVRSPLATTPFSLFLFVSPSGGMNKP